MAASKMDSPHRILSTRGRAAAPIPFLSWFFLNQLSLSHTGSTSTSALQTRLADTRSVSCDAISLPSTPKHHSHKKSNTHIYTRTHFLTQKFILLDFTSNRADLKRPDMHTSNLHPLPTMPTTVCVWAKDGCPVGQRQLSAPWTGLTLQGVTTALYSTPKWLAS